MSEADTKRAHLTAGVISLVSIIMIILMVVNYSQAINRLKDTKEIIVIQYPALEDCEFNIVSHNYRVVFTDDEADYWTEKYYIRVFRREDTYYLKIYTVSDFGEEN